MAQILIVDDEKNIRISLQAFLVGDGYRVETAADAAEALGLLDQYSFDVVVSDIILPGISGIDLLKAIRGAAPYAQVIMMTGEPTVSTAAEALRCGALDYLSKPIGKNAILRAVRNAVTVKEIDDERRRLEQENTSYQQNLEILVDARTNELRATMDELKTAQSELIRHERLNALAQLAAGICHDFNNVLMPIRGLTDFLVTHPETLDDKDEALRLLKQIHSATNDAKDIVRRMREFYRPRDAQEMAALDLNDLLRAVVELTRPRWETQARSEGRKIEVIRKDCASPDIVGNAPQLREALTNLVLNAVDAMPRGGTITLSAQRSGGSVTLCVADTGEGMAEQVRKRCLEPFFSTKGDRGTGMGLAMAHGIVTRHGGTLELESALTEGTEVRIHLPIPGLPRAPRVREARSPEAANEVLRILVIDDEEWSRTLLQRYLKGSGHVVALAPDGAAGLAMCANESFDVVITGRAMPGMNGDQVAVAMKQRYPHVAVLLLTGDIMVGSVPALPGVDGVLQKPITQRELHDMIVRLTELTTRDPADANERCTTGGATCACELDNEAVVTESKEGL